MRVWLIALLLFALVAPAQAAQIYSRTEPDLAYVTVVKVQVWSYEREAWVAQTPNSGYKSVLISQSRWQRCDKPVRNRIYFNITCHDKKLRELQNKEGYRAAFTKVLGSWGGDYSDRWVHYDPKFGYYLEVLGPEMEPSSPDAMIHIEFKGGKVRDFFLAWPVHSKDGTTREEVDVPIQFAHYPEDRPVNGPCVESFLMAHAYKISTGDVLQDGRRVPGFEALYTTTQQDFQPPMPVQTQPIQVVVKTAEPEEKPEPVNPGGERGEEPREAVPNAGDKARGIPIPVDPKPEPMPEPPSEPDPVYDLKVVPKGGVVVLKAETSDLTVQVKLKGATYKGKDSAEFRIPRGEKLTIPLAGVVSYAILGKDDRGKDFKDLYDDKDLQKLLEEGDGDE